MTYAINFNTFKTAQQDPIYKLTEAQSKDITLSTDFQLFMKRADVEELDTADIVAIYNAYSDKPVKKFADREIAVDRLLKLFELVAIDYPEGEKVTVAKIEDTLDIEKKIIAKAKKAVETPKVKVDKGVTRAPKGEIKQARAGTKTAILIDLLARDGGATIQELANGISAFGKPWNERAEKVKDWLRWDINSVKGYGIEVLCYNSKNEPVYGLVYPEGITAPLPHIEKGIVIKKERAAKVVA